MLRKIEAVALKKRFPLGPLLSLRCGGAAEYFARPKDMEELAAVLYLAESRRLDVRVMGGGTNLLVADAGVEGLVLSLGAGFSSIETLGPYVLRAGAAVTMGRLVRFAVTRGLGGLAPLAGIPGTLGGALAGNSGAADRTISSVVESVSVMDRRGRVRVVPAEECGFAYRASALDGIILSAVLRLEPSDPAEEAGKARSAVKARLRFPKGRTAGSTFKNPPGCSAGALLDAAGLKGASVGGAVVSVRHANFIINRSDSADDVARLIAVCRRAVYERFGVMLEPEIRLWGYPPDFLEVRT